MSSSGSTSGKGSNHGQRRHSSSVAYAESFLQKPKEVLSEEEEGKGEDKKISVARISAHPSKHDSEEFSKPPPLGNFRKPSAGQQEQWKAPSSRRRQDRGSSMPVSLYPDLSQLKHPPEQKSSSTEAARTEQEEEEEESYSASVASRSSSLYPDVSTLTTTNDDDDDNSEDTVETGNVSASPNNGGTSRTNSRGSMVKQWPPPRKSEGVAKIVENDGDDDDDKDRDEKAAKDGKRIQADNGKQSADATNAVFRNKEKELKRRSTPQIMYGEGQGNGSAEFEHKPGAVFVPGTQSSQGSSEASASCVPPARSSSGSKTAGPTVVQTLPSATASHHGSMEMNGEDEDSFVEQSMFSQDTADHEVHDDNDDEESGIIKATMVPEVPEALAVSERGLKRRRRILLVLGVIIVVGAIVGLAVGLTQNNNNKSTSPQSNGNPTMTPTASPTETPPPTLETVVQRGVLKCGVTDKKGFSIENELTGVRDGFDIDLCRAVASAVLGDASKIKTTVLSASERFVALRDREVDLLARVTTHTMERDVHEKNSLVGFSFAVPYVYDGLGFGGFPDYIECADRLTVFGQAGECAELLVCALEGTTHVTILETKLPTTAIRPVANRSVLYQDLIDEKCNVIAGEQFDVAESVLRLSGLQAEYQVGNNLFSKEPLGLVVRSNDDQWFNFVFWVFQALLTAEAQGITKTSAAASMPTTTLFGTEFTNMFRNAVGAVGNYGEIYARHLEAIVPRTGLNLLNANQTSGLIYSFPFGSLDVEGPPPRDTMERILTQEKLVCGIMERPGAGEQASPDVWRGIDAEYCRAVAAGLFSSSLLSVEFVKVLDLAEGQQRLANNEIDVMMGGAITFERSVIVNSNGQGFTFSTPYFYFPSNQAADPLYGETLSMVTLEGDPQWSDFCYWIIQATFFAEEKSYDSSSYTRMPTVQLFGPDLQAMFQEAIKVVGNYGDIYSRTMESTFPRNGTSNMLNAFPAGPQLYALPGLL